MFETTPPQPDSFDSAVLSEELEDPIAAVAAVELSRRFVRLCLCWTQPMVDDLAAQETMLRKPGGPELAGRQLALRLYQRIDPQVFGLLRPCVPLAHAEFTLSLIEEMLRTQFGEVVKTAITFLLSHDRDTAIQMTSVATTMGGREVRSAVARIIAETRLSDDDH